MKPKIKVIADLVFSGAFCFKFGPLLLHLHRTEGEKELSWASSTGGLEGQFDQKLRRENVVTIQQSIDRKKWSGVKALGTPLPFLPTLHTDGFFSWTEV